MGIDLHNGPRVLWNKAIEKECKDEVGDDHDKRRPCDDDIMMARVSISQLVISLDGARMDSQSTMAAKKRDIGFEDAIIAFAKTAMYVGRDCTRAPQWYEDGNDD